MMYQIEIAVCLFLSLILIGIREGLVIKDKLDGKDSPFESLWWHRIGGFIRGFLILAVFLLFKPLGYASFALYAYTGSAFILAGVWYNIAINLINGWKWYNLGTTASTDRFFKNLFKCKNKNI